MPYDISDVGHTDFGGAQIKGRFIFRVRDGEPTNLGRKFLNLSAIEPPLFIMERKMLLTLTRRAEEAFADESNISVPPLSA